MSQMSIVIIIVFIAEEDTTQQHTPTLLQPSIYDPTANQTGSPDTSGARNPMH
jgi:hypothetical protein